MWYQRKIVFVLFVTILLASCKSNRESTIDQKLQHQLDSTLQVSMKNMDIDSAKIIVMSVKDAEIKAMIGVQKKDAKTLSSFTPEQFNSQIEPGSLFIPFSIMAAIENRNISAKDSVDTGNGRYCVEGSLISDMSAFVGGYHNIEVSDCIYLPSNVGTVRTIEKSYGFSTEFLSDLERMKLINISDIGKCSSKSSVAYISIGYNLKLSPMQLITRYNAILNGGQVLNPVTSHDKNSIVTSKICSEKTRNVIREVLNKKGDLILKKCGIKQRQLIGGVFGRTNCTNKQGKPYDIRSLCFYYPVENPQYICLVIRCGKRDFDMGLYRSVLNVLL
jgi:cell division protein FtsI (penicillin-binding protein 3)